MNQNLYVASANQHQSSPDVSRNISSKITPRKYISKQDARESNNYKATPPTDSTDSTNSSRLSSD